MKALLIKSLISLFHSLNASSADLTFDQKCDIASNFVAEYECGNTCQVYNFTDLNNGEDCKDESCGIFEKTNGTKKCLLAL